MIKGSPGSLSETITVFQEPSEFLLVVGRANNMLSLAQPVSPNAPKPIIGNVRATDACLKKLRRVTVSICSFMTFTRFLNNALRGFLNCSRPGIIYLDIEHYLAWGFATVRLTPFLTFQNASATDFDTPAFSPHLISS